MKSVYWFFFVQFIRAMNKLAPADNRALTRQVAARWNCHHETIRKWQREGLLTCIKLGRHRRYLLSDILKAEESMAALGAVRKPLPAKQKVTAKRKAAAQPKAIAA
jgi:hypothetical protein